MSKHRPYYDLSRTLYERESLVPRDDVPPPRNNFDHLYHRKEVIDAYMQAQNERMMNIEGRLTAAENINATQDATLSDHENRIQALEQGGGGGASFPIYPVNRYGAVGDGTAPDEGPAIQAAIDVAGSAGGGIVFIPEGIYNLQSTLYIRPGVRLVMARGAVLRRNSSNLDGMIRPSGDYSGYLGVSNWGIEGGVIDASSFYETPCLPIGMSHGEGVVIRDVHIRSVLGMPAIWINAMKRVRVQNVTCTGYIPDVNNSEYYAIFLSAAITDSANVGFYPFSGSRDGTSCEDIVVEGCHIDGWRGGVGGESCVAGVYHRDIRIVNNVVQNTSFCGIKVGSFQGLTIAGNELHQVGTGIEVNSGGVAGQENNSASAAIIGNIIRGTTDVTYGYGVWLNEKGTKFVENSVVSGNVIDGAVGAGIYVQGSPFNNIINNHVTNSGERGIYINGSSNCSVQGNMIRNAGHMGIGVANSNYCSVTGNYVTRCAGYAIYLSGSIHCLINANMTYDNRLNSSIATVDAEIAVASNADYCAFLNNVTRSPINTRGVDMTSTVDNPYLIGNDCRLDTGAKTTIVGGTGTDKTSTNYAN